MDWQKQSYHKIGRWWWVIFLCGAFGYGVWSIVSANIAPITATDLKQHRANKAALVPNENYTVSQSFSPQRNELSELELLIVRYNTLQQPENGKMVLSLSDEAGKLIARDELPVNSLKHNQTYKMTFQPQEHSAEMKYTLLITGENNTTTSVWGYTLDVIGNGTLIESPTPSRLKSLRLITYYQLSVRTAIASVAETVGQTYGLWVVAILFLLAPTLWWRNEDSADILSSLTVRLALGMSIWPLLWEWLTLIGWHWSRSSLWIGVGASWLASVAYLWKFGRIRFVRPRWQWQDGAMGLILLTGAALKILAARDLAFLPWVDSSHHALITAVMAKTGQAVYSYEPYLSVNAALYHYGYHSLTSSLLLMTGIDSADLHLQFHQLISAFIPLTVYTAATAINKRRGSGVVAAFLVAIAFFFPAYYLSWGRSTQLSGMVILAVLIAQTWQLLENPSWRKGGIVSILASGLFLVHFRVLLLYAPFAVILALWAWRKRGTPIFLAAGLGTGCLVLPRLLILLRQTSADFLFSSEGGYNAFPISYIQTGWERYFIGLAFASLALILVRAFYRHLRLAPFLLLIMVIWVSLGEWLGWGVVMHLLGFDLQLAPFAVIPTWLGIPFLRTAVVIVLSVITFYWRPKWYSAVPLALALWLSWGHLLTNAWYIPLCFLLLTVSAETQRERAWNTVGAKLIIGWVTVLFLLLLGRKLCLPFFQPAVCLPETWVVNINSMYISLFLPLSILLGSSAVSIWDGLQAQGVRIRMIAYVALGMLLMRTVLFGIPYQIEIINEQTILGESADRTAIAWIKENLPTSSKIAVSSWYWLAPTWAAQDGGGWILPLANRMTTTPPVDYIYDAKLGKEVNDWNEQASQIADWTTPSTTRFLRDSGVTHLYVGARGGFLDAAKLTANPDLTLIYSYNGAFIFSVNQ